YLREQLDQGRANQIRALFISQSPSAPPPRAPLSVLDFYVRSGMTEDEFNLVSDALTTTVGPWRTGLINVNTAGETVLACVPGIGPDKAADVVSARLSRTQQDTSIAWIVPVLDGNSSGGTGTSPAGVAGQYITGQSWQVSADIAAVGRHGRG